MSNYFKNQPIHDKHSFKLVGSVQDVFSKPGQLVLIVSLFLFTMVNASVSQGPVANSRSVASNPAVLGEATSIEANDPENQVVMYKLSVQNLLVPYLEQRIEFMTSLEQSGLSAPEHANWLGILKQTQLAIMGLVVPPRFKDTHLLIIASLLEEISILESPIDIDVAKFNEVNGQWEDILLRNPWLNDR